ncbi:hypothetical protein QVD17_17959 [Tagetes erecta]|uniref:Gnk2-homologous domain-containing protein n=1 Tax=Tagetes erecta TaxID=13708 RepID=A0AAD8NVC4_TARER|nr:hypothetical protein QVD17_17959 [Tagetes erecta]
MMADQPTASSDVLRCNEKFGNYGPNSAYKKNLAEGFKLLASEAAKDKNPEERGFGFTFTGEDTDEEVMTISICPGYIKLNDCGTCVNDAILLLQKCPNQKKAMAWKNNTCLVRYEPVSFKGFDPWGVGHEISKDKVEDIEGLEKAFSQLFDNLLEVSDDNHPLSFAFGTQPYGSDQHLYVAMQFELPFRQCQRPDRCANKDVGLPKGMEMYVSLTSFENEVFRIRGLKFSLNTIRSGMVDLDLFTSGYMAPECVLHGQFSVKLDVFSFGVLVPTMSTVVLMLNSFSLTLWIPSEPAFFIQNTAEHAIVREESSKGSESLKSSINYTSISDMIPR